MLAGALALAVTIAGTFTLIPAVYASTAGITVRPAPDLPRLPALIPAVTARTGLPVRHVVRTGDTLAGLAVHYCHGTANDWTGFYHQNKTIIGGNPNLILPGQVLTLTACTDPPALLHLGSTYHAPRRAVRHAAGRNGKIWKVTYGYPNYCGDGDGDGWDVACHAAATPRAAVRHAGGSAVTGSSHYSYAGLEALWVAAGGPGWAASAAASVAECESGGNVYAHNPSGATGLFQILGQVVGGNLFNPYVNALNAVAKFKASGDSWAQWVCKP